MVNVVTGLSRETGAALAAHPGVDKVAFTGSTATGRAVAHAAADNLNKVTLELGGKSPQIVFPDADLAAAANGLVAGVFAATGQTCMAGSRLIVHDDVHDELVRLVAERAARIKLGDPNDPETEMGPVANRPQYEKVRRLPRHRAATRARPSRTAARPRTASAATSSSRPCSRREAAPTPCSARRCSGRCSSAVTFTDEDEALKLANDTPYGLAGAVWTKDVHRAHRVAGADPGGHGVDQRLPGGRAVACRSAGSATAGSAGRTALTRSTSTTENKSVWVELTGGTRDPFILG